MFMVIPSGNQTWEWKNKTNQMMVSSWENHRTKMMGFPLLHYQRAGVVLLELLEIDKMCGHQSPKLRSDTCPYQSHTNVSSIYNLFRCRKKVVYQSSQNIPTWCRCNKFHVFFNRKVMKHRKLIPFSIVIYHAHGSHGPFMGD